MLSSIPHLRHKMAFALELMRVQVQHAIGGFHDRCAVSGADGQGKSNGRKLGMLIQKLRNHLLILHQIQGAGAVHQPPAGLQHLDGGIQDAGLPGGASGGRLLVPFQPGLRVAAEHALTAAGGIHQNGIEAVLPLGAKLIRISGDHQGVADAHTLNIPTENVGPAGDRLVADQQAFTRQHPCNLCAFAAGSSAQIQHPFPGLRVQHADGGHGTGFLNIVGSRLMERMSAQGAVVVQVPAAIVPRHRLQQVTV